MVAYRWCSHLANACVKWLLGQLHCRFSYFSHAVQHEVSYQCSVVTTALKCSTVELWTWNRQTDGQLLASLYALSIICESIIIGERELKNGSWLVEVEVRHAMASCAVATDARW